MLIEFLRVNHRIKKRFGEYIRDEDYPLSYQGYRHMSFEKKKQLIKEFKTKEITVCDFDHKHLNYWKKEFNPNPNDCCNLRGIYPNPRKNGKAEVQLH